MDFSQDEAAALINMPKYIIEDDERQNQIQVPMGARSILLNYDLLSESGDYSFGFSIKQSAKNNLKISLHYQEDSSKIGLLRIDYGGRHKNPEILTNNVPTDMLPYVGVRFDYKDNHIHKHVEGYGTLEWAIPLVADSFPIKTVGTNTALKQAITSFARIINIQTQFVFEERLFL